MMRPLLLPAALLLALTIACSSDDDNAAPADSTPTTSARTASPTRTSRAGTPTPGIINTSDPNAPLYIALGDGGASRIAL